MFTKPAPGELQSLHCSDLHFPESLKKESCNGYTEANAFLSLVCDLFVLAVSLSLGKCRRHTVVSVVPRVSHLMGTCSRCTVATAFPSLLCTLFVSVSLSLSLSLLLALSLSLSLSLSAEMQALHCGDCNSQHVSSDGGSCNLYHWKFIITNLIPQESIFVTDAIALRQKFLRKFMM